MNYTVVWSAEAESTYRELLTFLEDRWSTKQMIRFVERCEEVVAFIEHNPLLYPVSETKKIHRAVISPQTSLYYYLTGEIIVLLSFEDNRQNPDRLQY